MLGILLQAMRIEDQNGIVTARRDIETRGVSSLNYPYWRATGGNTGQDRVWRNRDRSVNIDDG